MSGEAELPHGGAGSGRNCGEDTVELQLTPDEQLELARAATAAGSPRVALGEPAYDRYVCRRTDRIDHLSTVTFAVLVLSIFAVTGLSAFIRQPPAHTVSTLPPTVPAPVTRSPPAPQSGAVRVVNPFDAAEIFVFPAATTEEDARVAVADLLLQRARERRRQGLDLRRANKAGPTSVAPDTPTEVFVTRASGPAYRFTDSVRPDIRGAE